MTMIVHACPVGDSGVTPCCGKTPFELGHASRMTLRDDLVTCKGGVRITHIFLRIEAPGVPQIEAEIGTIVTSPTGVRHQTPEYAGSVFEVAHTDQTSEGRQFVALLADLLRAAADEFNPRGDIG
jgi:hypothetical protein